MQTLEAMDPDGDPSVGDIASYQLGTGAGDIFVINSDTGVVSLASMAKLDRDDNPQYKVIHFRKLSGHIDAKVRNYRFTYKYLFDISIRERGRSVRLFSRVLRYGGYFRRRLIIIINYKRSMERVFSCVKVNK